MDNKMKDSDVIKGLGNMQYGGHSCKNCNFKITKGDDRCGLKGCNISRQAALLINRQKEEIERLNITVEVAADICKTHIEIINKQQAEVEKLSIELEAMRGSANSYKLHYETAKSESITEYMEEVKRRCIESGLYPVIIKNILHNVKEDMVGENE